MNQLLFFCAFTLVSLAILRAVLTLVYLFSTRDRIDADQKLGPNSPRVAVFMPVRGADPSLPDAIQYLLRQDYTNFRVTIVVDSPGDESWNIVRDTMASLNDPRVNVVPLTRRQPECSLVCNGLLQFLESLPNDVELVTFCGSDMVVARNWMSEMVKALDDPSVGSTLGNRWYMSPQAGWGWMIRYLWNVVANTLAWQFRIPWGGTVCLRVRDIERAGLKHLWAKSMIEDIPIRTAIEGIGLTMKYVPELLVINREEIGFRQSIEFLRRQMFWILKYSARSFSISFVALLFSAATSLLILLTLVSLMTGNYETGAAGAAALACAALIPLPLLLSMERRIRIRMNRRGEPVTPLGASYILRMPLAVLLTQMVLGVLVVIALRQQTVRWRGVVYRVNGPFDARLISDASSVPAE